MDILFSSRKLAKDCNDSRRLQRRYGQRTANLVRQRLDELYAADNLAEIGRLPAPRCHELTGNRKGTLSVDLDHPRRLLFEPANEPVPQRPDRGLDWTRVTVVRILRVEDTHG